MTFGITTRSLAGAAWCAVTTTSLYADATFSGFAPQQTFPVLGGPRSVAVGDFDGDGEVDLAVTNDVLFTNAVSILLGVGDGSFAPQLTFPVGNSPRAITAADFNGDSALDLVVGNFSSSDVSVLLNLTGSVVSAPDLNCDGVVDGVDLAAMLANWGDCAKGEPCVGDLNGDGVIDGADLASLLANWGMLD